MVGTMMQRVSTERRPRFRARSRRRGTLYQSVNYVTCHDGDTLYDLVSYNSATGWNCGHDAAMGVPATCASAMPAPRAPALQRHPHGGDEFMQTQYGETTCMMSTTPPPGSTRHPEIPAGPPGRCCRAAGFWRCHERYGARGGWTCRGQSRAFAACAGPRRPRRYLRDLQRILERFRVWRRVVDTSLASPDGYSTARCQPAVGQPRYGSPGFRLQLAVRAGPLHMRAREADTMGTGETGGTTPSEAPQPQLERMNSHGGPANHLLAWPDRRRRSPSRLRTSGPGSSGTSARPPA